MSVLLDTRELDTREADRQAWLEARRKGIGSSDAAAVAGLDPYRSPMAVYLDKRGELPTDEDSEQAYWGRRLEPLLAEEVASRLGVVLSPVEAILQHPEHPWMLAEPDRITEDGRVVELKTTAAWHQQEWQGSSVPERVLVQVQHQMAVTGAPGAIAACLIGGQRLVIREVPRDDELIASLIEIERRFWFEHVVQGIPPDPDGSEAAQRLLHRLYPEAAEGRSVLLELEAEDKLYALLDAQAQLKEVERRICELQQWFEHRLGDAEYGLIRGIPRVRWQTIRQVRLDTRVLEKEHPDLVARYRRETTYRRFSILRVDEEE